MSVTHTSIAGHVGQVIQRDLRAENVVINLDQAREAPPTQDALQAQIDEERAFRDETGCDYGARRRAAFISATRRYDLTLRQLARIERAGYARYLELGEQYVCFIKPVEMKILRGLGLILFVLIALLAVFTVLLADAGQRAAALATGIPLVAMVWYLWDLVRSYIRPATQARKMAERDAQPV